MVCSIWRNTVERISIRPKMQSIRLTKSRMKVGREKNGIKYLKGTFLRKLLNNTLAKQRNTFQAKIVTHEKIVSKNNERIK